MLVEQRNEWKLEFEGGDKPFNPVLDEYRSNRNSESWRISSHAERVCEYIMFLEGQVMDYKELLDSSEDLDYIKDLKDKLVKGGNYDIT